LPPQQQKKQLKEKIKQIKHEVTKELSGREALVKMHEVYTTNPKLGDANSINSQLEDSKAKLDGLDSELAKYEGYLAAADGNGNGGTPTMARRSSVGSYQSTNSDTPSTPQAVNGTPAQSTPNTMSVSQTPHRQASSMYSVGTTSSQFFDDSLQVLDEQSYHGTSSSSSATAAPQDIVKEEVKEEARSRLYQLPLNVTLIRCWF